MIDLKELKRLAEVSIKDCKMFEHTPRRLFNENVTPQLILQLIKEHQEMREALESIASKDKPRHDDEYFWRTRSIERCAEVLARDTRIARQTLEGVSK